MTAIIKFFRGTFKDFALARRDQRIQHVEASVVGTTWEVIKSTPDSQLKDQLYVCANYVCDDSVLKVGVAIVTICNNTDKAHDFHIPVCNSDMTVSICQARSEFMRIKGIVESGGLNTLADYKRVGNPDQVGAKLKDTLTSLCMMADAYQKVCVARKEHLGEHMEESAKLLQTLCGMSIPVFESQLVFLCEHVLRPTVDGIIRGMPDRWDREMCVIEH